MALVQVQNVLRLYDMFSVKVEMKCRRGARSPAPHPSVAPLDASTIIISGEFIAYEDDIANEFFFNYQKLNHIYRLLEV